MEHIKNCVLAFTLAVVTAASPCSSILLRWLK